MFKLLRQDVAIHFTAFVFVVAVVATAAAMLAGTRQQELAERARLTEHFVSAAEATLNRNLLGIDLMLAGLPQLLDDAQVGAPVSQNDRTQRLLRGVQQRDMMLRDVVLLSAQGQVVAAADANTLRLGLALPAGFLGSVLAEEAPTLMVSAPVNNFMTGERSLYFARSVRLQGQALVAVAEVQLQLLADVIAQGEETKGLVVAFERDDGMLLATVPANERVLGSLIKPLSSAQLSGKVFQGPARLGGAESLVTARPTLYRNMQLSVSQPLHDAMARWRGERNVTLAVAGGFILLIVAVGRFALWNARSLRAARAQMAQSKASLEQALESMSDGLLLCDAQDRVLAWNARYLELFPWLRGVVAVGVPFERFIDIAAVYVQPDATEQEREAWKQIRRSRRHDDGGVHEQTLANGMVVHSVERATPEGGVVSVYRDITAGERRLQHALQAAEAANDSKSRFLAAMSHEIRTPLNAVLGLNGLILDTRLDAVQRKYAELIQSSGRSLLSLINDILDLSKVEAGCMSLRQVPFSPWQAVQDVMGMLGTRATARGLALDARCTPDPAQNQPPWLLGDADRFRQVLINLVGNALKFTERGRIELHLAYKWLPDGRVGLELSVQDTGIGIPAAALPTLFERFTQADNSSSRRYGGSGLGLAICREIITLMGGQISVRSKQGQGSTFRVLLALPVSQTKARAEALRSAPASANAAPRLHILVAEDDAVNQILIQALLEKLGHACDIVGDGRQAVAQVQRERYDLVLMDVQMPEMDGPQATRAIRLLAGTVAQIPIVAVTANAMLADRDEYMRAGMDDYVSKPIDPAVLNHTINMVLARSTAQAA